MWGDIKKRLRVIKHALQRQPDIRGASYVGGYVVGVCPNQGHVKIRFWSSSDRHIPQQQTFPGFMFVDYEKLRVGDTVKVHVFIEKT